ncbi:uncharacterized protein LOC143694321 [Agelaius phoeniceus]|uniref:uncharacterized protein LOC143694321 n=1 Tax=Agelaius phoeniceus TaxID=39638 RepID=UPI004055318C
MICPAMNASDSSASWTLSVLSVVLSGIVREWERLVGARAEHLETSPLLPRGDALGNPSSLGRAFGSRHVPSAQEQQDLCCSQQDRKNHLTDPSFAQSFGV